MLKSCQTTIEWHEEAGEIPPFFVSFGQDVGERGMTRREFIGAGLGFGVSVAMGRPIRSSIGGRIEYREGGDLPYDSEVKYLESTGTQWIDTMQTINTATDTIFLRYQLLYGDVYKWIFGEHQTNPRCGIGAGDGTGRRTCAYGNGTSYISDSFYFNHEHEMVVDGRGIALDDVIIRTYQNFSSIWSLWLFSVNLGANQNTHCSRSRIWRYEHIRSGIHIIDLLPVRFTNELNETEGAMYDLVSGELFRNQGTGSFIIGPDI